jgi:hypothetical protein
VKVVDDVVEGVEASLGYSVLVICVGHTPARKPVAFASAYHHQRDSSPANRHETIVR